jgi:hypothetical protein
MLVGGANLCGIFVAFLWHFCGIFVAFLWHFFQQPLVEICAIEMLVCGANLCGKSLQWFRSSNALSGPSTLFAVLLGPVL